MLGRAGRFVLALVAVAQLFGVIAGPLDHWRTSARMGPHVEPAGSSQSHYAHDEATCASCAISHMTAPSIRHAVDPAVLLSASHAMRRVAEVPPYREPRTQAAPRAPPAPGRVG
ncbi:MAG: hypothetical protein IPP90_02010 [Gemmatimonadaceae bacterium]|nr:hypothetical protein [Gemmatimonadaceae bacterium]